MTNKEICQAIKDGKQFYLFEYCTNPVFKGQRITAKILLSHSPGYKKNQDLGSVYRVGQFCLPGQSGGWKLMNREYSTLAGLLKAAKKLGYSVEII